MDVEYHIPYHVSYVGVLVRTDIMEEMGTGVGCALGCSALLGSDGVEGHQDAAIDCVYVIQEDSIRSPVSLVSRQHTGQSWFQLGLLVGYVRLSG